MTATQDKVTEAIKARDAGLADLMASESWIAYLDAQARFHDYSFGNTMLIMVQRPDATRVAGYKAWQKLGRQVRKGEKGLSILAPMHRKAEDKETGEVKSFVSGFRAVSVFDISQTEGDEIAELPIADLAEGDIDASIHAALVAEIERLGFTYAEEAIPGTAKGFTSFETKRVVIDETLSRPQVVKVTAHELAHVLMHDPSEINYHENRPVCEIEAESVAYVVLNVMGYDAGTYSLGYIAHWSGGKAEQVSATAERVQRTANKVLDAITGANEGKQSEQTTAA